MAETSAVFQSDRETGYLTDLFSSQGDFLSVEDLPFVIPADEYNIIYDGTVKPNYDSEFENCYYRPYRSYDERPEVRFRARRNGAVLEQFVSEWRELDCKLWVLD